MNDINFFSPYEKTKNNKNSLNKYLPFLIILLLLIGVSYYQIRLNSINEELASEVNQISEKIVTIEKSQEYEEVVALKEKNARSKELLTNLEAIVSSIDEQFMINKQMIVNLIKETPLNTYITSIDYRNHSIVVKCITDTYDSAAQYFYNLKRVESFETAFLPSIEEDDGDYSYQINIDLLGGENDEAQ